MAEIHNIDVVVRAQDNASNVLDRIINRFGIATKQGFMMGVAFKGIDLAIQYLQQSFTNLINYINEGIALNREYELSLARLSVSTDDFNLSMGELNDTVRSFSIFFGTSLSNVAGGLQGFIREGYSASDAVKLLMDSEKLAVVSGDDLNTVQNTVISTMQVFGLTAENSGYISEKLNQITGTTGISFSELDRILNSLATTIQSNGISLDTLADAMYTLDKRGVGGKKMLSELTDMFNDFNKELLMSIQNTTTLDDRFEKISSTTEFTFQRMKQLREVMKMDVTQFTDIGGMFDTRKYKIAVELVEELGKQGVKTIDDFNEKLSKELLTTVWLPKNFALYTGDKEITELARAIMYVNEQIDKTNTDDASGEIERLKSAYNDLKTSLQSTSAVLMSHTGTLKDLRSQREELISIYPFQEDLRYMIMGLIDASYATKIHNSATRELVDNLREQREEIDALNHVNQEYALEQNKNNLEIMQLQLSAMGRRGRYTREEKLLLKELEHANLEYRIKSLQNQNIIDEKTLNLDPLEDRLNKTRMWYDEEIYLTQDAYNKEIMLLNDCIDEEHNLWMQSLIDLKNVLDQKLQALIDYNNAVANLNKTTTKVGGSTVATKIVSTPVQAAEELRKSPLGQMVFGRLQHGTDYVPHTGLYVLHEGERVTPAGQNKTQSVNVKVEPIMVTANIYDQTDIQRLCQKIELGVQSGLIKGMTTIYK